MEALKITVSVAVIATVVSTVLGTMAAVGIHAMKKGWASWVLNISYLPMTMPDIVTGISLMLLFIQLNIPTGFWTMTLAHIAFDTPYVLFSVLPRLKQMDPNMYEAALDLGCKPWKAIYKVIIPEISPGIVTGMLMAFTMSIDDFIISYFTGGTVNNLSMAVYGSAKRGVSPSMYALFALMFVVVLTLLLIINKRSSLEDVRLSKALIKVGQGAFENCTSLDYIYIPGNVGIIGSWSFKGCTGLVEVDMTWTDITKIREGAFKNCSALTRIHLPENIQTLGDSCFYGIGATSFTVPGTVTSIEAWCFARANLKSITFKGNAPTIGEGAFNKITLTAYYPRNNATWTSAKKQNYGGTVTWKNG
jgi:spermidine/putrescine transport system permease protein